MLFEVNLPSLSPTMEEGKIVKWVKKENDPILSGEVLFEVETDKATMEYESPEDGYIVQVSATRGGMRGRQRVNDRGVLLAHLGQLVGAHLSAERHQEVVLGVVSVDEVLLIVGEPVVGRVHVGEQCVATRFGHLHRVEDGAHAGALAPRHIVMPRVLVTLHVERLLETHEFGGAGVRGDERVNFEFSETSRESHVLFGGERLIAEEDHLVLVQGTTNIGDQFVVEGPP